MLYIDTDSGDSGNSASLSAGAIAGIVVGCITGLVIVILVIGIIAWRRRSHVTMRYVPWPEDDTE